MISFSKNHPLASTFACTSIALKFSTNTGISSDWYLRNKAQIRINRAILQSGGISASERQLLEKCTATRALKTSALETMLKSSKYFRNFSILFFIAAVVNNNMKNN